MRIKGVAVAAMLAVGAVVAIGSADGAEHGKKDPPPRFTLFGKISAARYVDAEPAGDSPGDVLIFSQSLSKQRDGREVGTDQAACTRTTTTEAKYLCQGSFRLRGGQITIQGLDPPSRVTRHPLVVTGGSGRFRGARGEITVHHLSPTEDQFDFKLER